MLTGSANRTLWWPGLWNLYRLGPRVEGHTSSFLINQGHGEIEIDILIKEVLDVEFENIIFAANRLGGRKNLKPCFIILLFGLIGIRGNQSA